jgi:hypothetical protein
MVKRLLGEPGPHVQGYLEYIWESAFESGDPTIGTADMVEAVAEYPGDRGKLFRALLECGGPGRAGFIEPVPGAEGIYQIHDLFDHAPNYVQRRQEREAARKAAGVTLSELRAEAGRKGGLAKAANAKAGNGLANGSNLPESYSNCLANVATPAPAPAPEEEKTPPPTEEVCSEPATPASEPPAAEKVVLTFPTVGRGAKTWDLTESKLAEYRESFPGVDVLSACRAALQWARDNPEKRKTAKGMPAFLTRWLSKEQNAGGGQAGGNSRMRFDGLKAFVGRGQGGQQRESKRYREPPADEAEAYRVVEHYQKAVRPAHGPEGATSNVEALLASGVAAADLERATDAYAAASRSQEPQYRLKAANFFGRAAGFRDYLGGVPMSVAETPEEREARWAREREEWKKQPYAPG